MSNHTYITYSEISGYKPTETELDNLVASLDKESTFRFLTMLNNFLALFPLDFDEAKNVEIQRFFVANLLDKELFEKLRRYVENVSLVDRPIFLRQSILLLMKKILLGAATNGGLNPDNSREARNKVGKLCLMISNFTLTAEQEQKTVSNNPHTDEETERVFNELLAQMIPVMELMNPPEFSAAIVRTKEYIRLSNTHFRDTFEGRTLSSYFESLTGLTLERFLQMVIGIYAALDIKTLDELIQNPANFNIRKSTYFSNLNYPEKEINSFYKLTITKFEKLNSEIESNPLRSILQLQYDYTVFRKYPILHLNEDILTPIDFSFLIEKVSFGLYHTILNCFLQNGIDPQTFFQHWGHIFEIYVNNIFRAIYPEISNRFHPNTFYKSKDRIEAFDGIIEYPNSLIVMQYKGGLLNAKAKYGGNVDLLLKEMNEKYGTKFPKSAISQLSRNIERLFNSKAEKRLRIPDLDFSNVKNVYPVLIVNEISLEFGLANWRLKEWFKKEIKTKMVEESISIKPLMILTVDDLERIVPYLEAEDFTFLEFVEFYSKLDYVRFSRFLIGEYWYEPMTLISEVFKKFCKKRKIDFRPNKKIQYKFEDLTDEIIASFK